MEEKNNIVYMLDGCDLDPNDKCMYNFTIHNQNVDLDLGYENGYLNLNLGSSSHDFPFMKFSESKNIYIWCRYYESVSKTISEPRVTIYHHGRLTEIFRREKLEFNTKNLASIMPDRGYHFEINEDRWHLDRLKHIHIQNDTAISLAEDVIPDCTIYAKRIEFLLDSLAGSYEEFFISYFDYYVQKIFFTKPIGESFPIVEFEFDCTCYTSYKIVKPIKDMMGCGGSHIYNYNVEKKYALKEIAELIDTEVYYRHPPVHVSFGDGYYISDKYKNDIGNKWKEKDRDELKFERSKDWLGYPYRYYLVGGVKFDVNYPPLSDTIYWMSKNPNHSSFASDFETALNKLLLVKDNTEYIIRGLGFIRLNNTTHSTCSQDTLLFPKDSASFSDGYSNFMFQVPETEYFFIVKFTVERESGIKKSEVIPWWKDMVRSHQFSAQN